VGEPEICERSSFRGARIRELRKARDLTQGQLAARAKVSVGAIRDLEQGRVRRPHSASVARMADVLGVTAADLLADVSASSADVWAGICGPLEIKVNGAEAVGLTNGMRIVLGLLSLHAGTPVMRDSIISALYGNDPRAGATGIVHTYISRVRGLLGRSDDGESRISRVGGGYRLDLGTDSLDLLAFREAAVRAREAADAGHACAIYERAMLLWRGQPLEDVEGLRDHPCVTALANERLQVTLEYAKRAEETGQHKAVLPHLTGLAAGNPFDERLHAALMVALAAGGQRAEALHVYEEVRRRLDDELGVLPGDELREAHQRILREGFGSGTARDVWHPVRQLPAAPWDFVGREAELAALRSAMTVAEDQMGVPLVIICGEPGIGKTALALSAAHAASGRFPDGQLWVQLGGASGRPRDPGDVLGELLRALGAPVSALPGDLFERVRVFRSLLAGRRVLVVADDAASAAQVEPLLPGTAGCALIVTSRMDLSGLNGARHVPLDVLSPHDGASLLTRLVGADRVTADPAAAIKLASACGGLPLALRMVGERLATRPSWPLSAMVRKLGRAESRLSGLDAGSLSVRASIASSCSSLPERCRLAFRRLALLGPNNFAAWVVPVLLGERPAADDVLDDLVSRSLVAPEGVDASGEPRYRLHDLLREYASEQLAAEPPLVTASAIERLLHAWLELAKHADDALLSEPCFPPDRRDTRSCFLDGALVADLTRDPIAWFRAEQINLVAAVDQAEIHGYTDLHRELISCLTSFYYLSERKWRRAAVPAGDAVAAGSGPRL
jgi:DNA-binding SARP family transcriptional activator/DNA-binding XRE family transcriptional regulator